MDLCKGEFCTGCTACASTCPKQCIQMTADAEGFLRPTVDETKCLKCGACQKACPTLHPNKVDSDTAAYAAMHRSDEVRLSSTSGGVFSALCHWIFSRGGAVFGAAYADDFSVMHRCIRTMEEIPTLRTAKYAQSEIGDSFQQVRQLLNDGQYVLFSGTPCQIGGLRSFLGEDYERLILVDVICHGVPSPKVWARYIEYRSQTDATGAAPAVINLRSKETGWPGYSIRFDYTNGQHYLARNSEDPFLRCFVGDLCLRPSCYNCQFKGASRNSDFTLGDYWGVWTQLPEFNDGKGTSLVLLHSEKAKTIWQEISEDLQVQAVPVPDCLNENPSALRSSQCPEKRSEFMSRYCDEDFQMLTEELLPLTKPVQTSLLKRAIKKLKRLVLTQLIS